MKTLKMLGFAALALSAIVCLGSGTTWHYKCQSSGCGFQGDFNLTIRTLGGYCHTCTNFVYVRWSPGEKPPEPIGLVWNSATGEFAELYPCPACKKPFLSITDFGPSAGAVTPGDNIHCPKCKRNTLLVSDPMAYD